MSQATVFPFILRGVNLLGVDSVNVPLAGKQALWDKLANEWTLSGLSALTQTISPADIPDILQKIQQGETLGRYVLDWSQG
jgi:alcohol dehydrogenase